MIRILIVVLILIEITFRVYANETFGSSETCNVTYYKSDIIINYYNNQSIYCVNNIKAPNGYHIVITILELDIPRQTSGHSVCNRNHLTFSPVRPTSSRVLKLCGQTNDTSLASQKRIISYNSSLTFQFSIDNQMRFVSDQMRFVSDQMLFHI